jgi:hypothetical protein
MALNAREQMVPLKALELVPQSVKPIFKFLGLGNEPGIFLFFNYFQTLFH